ncbi:GNAT family N-acetyltransferase [Leptolyngbya sp. AN02str]|uniref:GNAT family N-acetyltransferase n=1 Tax=Leptolyngbya sp. AN02str TaxID=3423363 RepID=UPI003D31A4B1
MIRRANPGDVKAVLNLLQQLGYSPDAEQVLALLETGSTGNQTTGDTTDEVYVYEQGLCVVAFVALHRQVYFPTMEFLTRVMALCVDEAQRSRGIGQYLLRFVENLAYQRGDRAVEVTSSLQRDRTHQFYLNQGYSQHSYKFIKEVAVTAPSENDNWRL